MSALVACCCSSKKLTAVQICDAVYPADDSDKPISSNLSKLTFLLNQHPAKLSSVFNHILNQRLKKDVAPNLLIIKEILKECSQHLLLYSNFVLEAISETINKEYLTTTSTYVYTAFNNCWNFQQNDLLNVYLSTFKIYCDMLNSSKNELALQAIDSAAKNPNFHSSSNISEFIDLMVPGVLTLYYQQLLPEGSSSSPTSLKDLSKTATIKFSNMSSIIYSTQTEHISTSKGIVKLSTDFITSEPAEIPKMSTEEEKVKPNVIVNLCKSVLLHIAKDSSTEIAKKISNEAIKVLLTFNNLSIIQTIFNQIIKNFFDFKPQHLYIHCNNLTEMLESNTVNLKEKYISIILLTDLISVFGPFNSLELCQVFSKLIFENIEGSTDEDEIIFKSALTEVMGSLGKNIQYPEQVNDMLTYLINRLALPSLSSVMGNLNEVSNNSQLSVEANKRIWILKCLIAMTNVRLRDSKSPEGKELRKRCSITRKPVAHEVMSPLLTFLGDTSAELRALVSTLIKDLILMELEEFNVSETRFHRSLIRNLYIYIKSPNNVQQDFNSIFDIVKVLIQKGGRALIETLRMILTLENEVCEDLQYDEKHSNIIGNLALSTFTFLSRHWGFKDVEAFVLDVKFERIAEHTIGIDVYFNLQLTEEHVTSSKTESKKLTKSLRKTGIIDAIEKNVKTVTATEKEESSCENFFMFYCEHQNFLNDLCLDYKYLSSSSNTNENIYLDPEDIVIKKHEYSVDSLNAFTANFKSTKPKNPNANIQSPIDENASATSSQDSLHNSAAVLSTTIVDIKKALNSDEVEIEMSELNGNTHPSEVTDLLDSLGTPKRQSNINSTILEDLKEPNL
ncbi:hypothetical protein HK099_003054 [Clydaea vesicula]|uniref:Uncharacterized protein n=1 Tax=Clydaea vesicula TaxID=447962 RepID=A0AAD5U5B6_9FUNG|nr:hypothetical protein HK099_003054 [Clydaea vesicula]